MHLAALLTSRAVVALDADGVAVERTWALDFEPSDLLFDPEHDLMFAGAGAGSTIAALRMSSGDVLVEHPTGSPGRKFGKGIGTALYFVVAVAAAAGGAPTGGGPGFTVRSSTSMVLGEDGSTVYVLNPYTNDVSIFDVAKQDVVDIVHTGGGSQRIVQLPGDPDFWVQSRESLAHFDTATNRIDRTIDFDEALYNTVSYDTARERAWISTPRKVRVFDLRTGEAVGQAELPEFAHFLWFDPSRDRSSETSPESRRAPLSGCK